jgi:hypothetical protein
MTDKNKTNRKKAEYWLSPDKLDILRGWRRGGSSLQAIADEIKISLFTLQEWKKNYDDIADALEEGVEEAVAIVTNSLYKSANGMFYDEIVKEYEFKDGIKYLARERSILRYVPPNPTSLIFYLSNRRSDIWKRYNQGIKKEVEEQGESGVIELAKIIEYDEKNNDRSTTKDK